ncbi:RHS repeat domain-containing protein, partial [Psychroserpens luteolus]|uniref:hypothetical protein n=1 Tax=Psychroserpens luteolus TaxID=2855840 RepID=UPI001E2E0938
SYVVADATPFSIPHTVPLQAASEVIDAYPPVESVVNNFSTSINHIYTETYDVTGTLVGKSGSYYNDLGKPTLSYSWDREENKVWGTQTLYDKQGRPALQTLSAPSCGGFVGGFLSGTFSNYVSDITNYDGLSEIDVVNNDFSSLRRYYSDDNSNEELQSTTTRPYVRTVYDKLNPGNEIKAIGGNQMGGDWKTGYSFTVPAAQEMYYVFGKNYFEGPINGIYGEQVTTEYYKTVVMDPHGNEVVSFIDKEGRTLATARSGGSQTYPVVSVIGEQGYIDIHLPKNVNSVNFLSSTSHYTIYDLKTGDQIPYTSMSGGNVYRISATPSTNENTHHTYISSSGGVNHYSGSRGVRYNVNYYDYSLNYYDVSGRLTQRSQPLGFNASCLSSIQSTVTHGMLNSYVYNSLGELLETTSPDEGTTKFKYRRDGQIRFSQNSKQALVGEVTFIDYDSKLRPKKSGVGAANFSTLNPDTSVLSTNLKEIHETIYDLPDASLSGVLSSGGLNPNNYKQTFISGNVSMTKTIPDGNSPIVTSSTWYSYDIYGRVLWTVQDVEGLGLKTIHYKYDNRGGVKQVIYQQDIPSELFVHRYSYDKNNSLSKVETSTNGVDFEEQADYEYYKSGELKRTEIANGLQGLDYVYTLSGQLKSINNPNLSSDPGNDINDLFGMSIDYYNGDYVRSSSSIKTTPQGTNRYDGNIKATRWSTKGLTSPSVQDAYTYSYNSNKWLDGATFGSANSNAVISSSADYKVSNITYDANGNIETLKRTKNSVFGNNQMDNFSYSYNSNKNQLNRVSDTDPSPSDADDLESQPNNNYQYNAIGQLYRDLQAGITYEYNTTGLVTRIKKTATNLPIVEFAYDDKGQRISKQSFNGSGTPTTKSYYIRDTSGNPLAIYNNSTLVEH